MLDFVHHYLEQCSSEACIVRAVKNMVGLMKASAYALITCNTPRLRANGS
jgi:hypothetical protein